MSGVSRGFLAALLAAALLTAYAGPPSVPANGILGYGTLGVSSYLNAGQGDSLGSLMERCRTVSASAGLPRPQSLEAACDQLHRTARNQPGNSIGPARAE
jgi:hypothetical protein